MVIDKPSSASSLADIAIVMAVSVLAFLGESAVADDLPWGEEARGVVAVLAGAAAAVAVTLLRGGTPADLGFRALRRWTTAPLWVLGILIVFIVAQNVVPLLLSPFFDLPRPDMSRYDVIRGNPGAAILFAVLLPLTAAVPEEILYRGFLIERFANLFGGTKTAAVAAVLAQALVFGSVHFQWGPGGILATSIMGIVWGFAYLLSGRNLWIVILAHSMAHIALVTQLYLLPPVQS